jgi:hypothetical protein
MLAGHDTRREVAEVAGRHGVPPAAAQRLAQVDRGTRPNRVHAVMLAPVESSVCSVKEIVLPQERALGGGRRL